MSTAGILQIEILAGVAKLAEDMKRAERVVGDTTGRMEKSVTSLQNQFSKLGFGMSIGLMLDQARRLTDSYVKVTAQMRIATASQAEYAKGMEDVRRISTAAQAGVEATTMLYTRLTNSLKQHGATQQDVGRITESVSLGLKAYGATTAEAASAMLQLSQAFGSGRLGGEEFRAVSEAMPNMMVHLAKSMGVPKSALRDLSMQGKITSEVMMKAWNDPALIAGLTKQAEMTRTITGEITVFRNNLTMLVGEFMGASGSTAGITTALRAMSDAVLMLAENLKTIITLTTILGIAYAGKYAVGLALSIEKTIALAEATAMNAAMNLKAAEAVNFGAKAGLAQAAANALATGNSTAATAANSAYRKSVVALTAAQQASSASAVTGIMAIGVAIRTAIMAHPIIAATTAIAAIVVAIANWDAIVKSSKASLKWFQEDFLGGIEFLAADVGISLGELVQKLSLLATVTVPQLKSGEFKKQWDELGKLAEQSRIEVAARIAGLDKKTVDHEKLAAAERYAADRKEWEKLTNTKAQQRQAEIAALNEQYLKIVGGQEMTSAVMLAEAERYNVALANINDKYSKEAVTAAGNAHTSKMQQTLSALEAEANAEEGKLSRVQKVSLEYQALKVKEQTLAEYGIFVRALETAAALDEKDAQEALNKQLADGRKYYEDYWTGVETSTEKLIEQAKQQEWENTLIGKTKEEIAALTLLRENETIAKAEANLETMKLNKAYADEIIKQEALIDAMKRKQAAEQGKATAEAAQAAIDAQTKSHEEMWKKVDGFAHDAFDNIFDKGKNAFEEIGKVIKKSILDMLYKMTVQKWLIPVSITGGVAASGLAGAATGNYGGGTGLMDIASSGLSMAMSGLTASQALTAASAYGSAALSATSLAEGISMATSGLSLAMPYIGAAVAAVSLIGGLFGGKGTPTTSLGNVAAQYSPTGIETSRQTYFGGSSAGADAQIRVMQDAYMRAAAGLGITTAATQFSYGANTGRNGQSPNFALGGGILGQAGFYQPETAMSDAAVQLAASRAIFTALQESDLPAYLANMFDGLTAGSMTQQDIDNTLAFAGSVKQMRDALLETRTPLEVLRQQVTDGTAAFATSAATFRTDFVAAIDAGINPQVFAQWQQLGTAIDQLTAADAEAAAQNAEAVARAIEELNNLASKVESTRQSIISAYEGFVSRARSTADAVISAQQAITNGYLAAVNAVKSTQQAITNGYLTAQDRVAAAQQRITDISRQAAQEMRGFADGIREFVFQMRTTDLGGSNKASQFAAMLAAFTITTAQAGAGDITALGNMTGQAQALLEIKRATSASAFEYAQFAGQIAGTLDQVATLADGRAGPLAVAVDPMTEALAELNVAQDDLIKWQRATSISGASTERAVVDYASDWRTANADLAEWQQAIAESGASTSVALTNYADEWRIADAANTIAQNELLTATNSIHGINVSQLTELQRLNQLIATFNTGTAAVVTAAAARPTALTPGISGTSAAGATYAGTTDTWTSISGAESATTAQIREAINTFVAAGDIVGLYEGARNAGVSLADLNAIAGAPAGSAEAWAAANGLPIFATGINEVPYDMPAFVHKGEEIKPVAYVDRDRAARDETNALLARLQEEVRQMREENKAGQVAIARNTNRSAKVLEQFDGDGMPATRVI